MRLRIRLVLLGLALMLFVSPVFAQTTWPSGADLAAIKKLHQQDMAATLAGDPNFLNMLWADDGVVMEQGSPAHVGKAAILKANEESHAAHPKARVLSYTPVIVDQQFAGDVAYEWGVFETTFQESASAKPVSFQGRFLRIMKRQMDGSWKFVRVMWNTDKP